MALPTAEELRTFLLGAGTDLTDAVANEMIRQSSVLVLNDGAGSASDLYSELVLHKSRILLYSSGAGEHTDGDVSEEKIADISIKYGLKSIPDIDKTLARWQDEYNKLLKTVIGTTHWLV